MTVNYTTLLGLAQPVTGTEANTWGTVVNDEITALIEEAIAGGETIDVTSGNVTLTDTDGVANQARNAILLITGTPGTSRNVIAPSASKVYVVVNGSNAAVVVKGAATTGVTIATGARSIVAWNGSDFVEVGSTGDVDGPASATDNAIARFDQTTGKIIQNSGVTIDDSNNVSGVAQLNATTVAATTGNITKVNATTVDTTNIEVTNIKAKDGTASASIADSTGVFSHATTTVFPAGSASTPAITTTGDTNTGIFFPAADTIAFAEGGAEAMRINSSGNVGIGTTSPATKLQIFSAVTADYGNIHLADSASATTGVGGVISFGGYKTTTSLGATFAKIAGIKENSTGGNEAGALTFTTNTGSAYTEAMRIDSSGNVGIGTTANDSWKIHANSVGDQIRWSYDRASYSEIFGFAQHRGDSGGVEIGNINNSSDQSIRFSNGSSYAGRTERARITSGGYFKASNSGSYEAAAGDKHEFTNTAGNNHALEVRATNASYTSDALLVRASRNTTNNSFYAISYLNSGAAAFKFRVADSGNVTNTNNSYGSISDVKLKQDIVDAGSQWNDIKNLRMRKYRWKSDPEGFLQIGLVAQEAELVSPGLIDEHPDFEEVEVPVLDDQGNPVLNEDGTPQVTKERNDLGTTTKAVKYSILYMKAVKALQEAMERIETLEAKVAALEQA